MTAIDGLLDAEPELLQVLAEMRDEQRRRLGRGDLNLGPGDS